MKEELARTVCEYCGKIIKIKPVTLYWSLLSKDKHKHVSLEIGQRGKHRKEVKEERR